MIFRLFIIIIITTFHNCDNFKGSGKTSSGRVYYTANPVVSSLFNNRMLLLFKGTYATDSPLNFSDYSLGSGNLYVDLNVNNGGGDPAMDLTALPSASTLSMAIDIGEIRISSKYQQGAAGLDAISSIKNNKAFWDYIAPVRQVYCTSPPYSQANPYTLFSNTCLDNKGAAKLAEVFSGDGTAYPSNDPTADSEGTSYANQTQLYQQSGKLNLWGLPTQYYFAGVYFRNFITGWAYQNGALITNTTFDNFPVVGTNIVPRNNYTPGTDDASKATVSTPLLFPLFYRVVQGHEDFQIRRGFDPYILEVRTNIKENLMVHSWTTTLGVVQTMVGFSDWRNAHNGELDMGGNLLVRARVIYPVTASSLYINGGTRTLKHYYAIYRQAEIDFTNQLPLAASPVKNGTTFIKYLQSGSYRVRCLADTTPQDGYPETVVRETTFNISDYPFNQKININLTCP